MVISVNAVDRLTARSRKVFSFGVVPSAPPPPGRHRGSVKQYTFLVTLEPRVAHDQLIDELALTMLYRFSISASFLSLGVGVSASMGRGCLLDTDDAYGKSRTSVSDTRVVLFPAEAF